jgi:hypothetical protein
MARLALAFVALALFGCSSIGGSAVRTGATRLPPYAGPVAIYVANPPPPGATELGVVEVHAAQQEATIETLMPLFVKRVAALGGNGALVDRVEPHFEWAAHPYTATYTYSCGFGAVCIGTSTSMVTNEILVLSIQGRALRVPEAAR